MKIFLGRGPRDPTAGREGETPLPAPHPPLRLRRLDSLAPSVLDLFSPKHPNETKYGIPHFLEQSYAPGV